jgi:hypothetical protein
MDPTLSEIRPAVVDMITYLIKILVKYGKGEPCNTPDSCALHAAVRICITNRWFSTDVIAEVGSAAVAATQTNGSYVVPTQHDNILTADDNLLTADVVQAMRSKAQNIIRTLLKPENQSVPEGMIALFMNSAYDSISKYWARFNLHIMQTCLAWDINSRINRIESLKSSIAHKTAEILSLENENQVDSDHLNCVLKSIWEKMRAAVPKVKKQPVYNGAMGGVPQDTKQEPDTDLSNLPVRGAAYKPVNIKVKQEPGPVVQNLPMGGVPQDPEQKPGPVNYEVKQEPVELDPPMGGVPPEPQQRRAIELPRKLYNLRSLARKLRSRNTRGVRK